MTIELRAPSTDEMAQVHSHAGDSVRECAGYRGDVHAPVLDGPCLLACIDGAVVGSASWRIVDMSGVLDHMWVDPDARGVGVGTALLRASVQAVRSAGCSRFVCDVQPGNRSMKNLLEQQGIVARMIRSGVELD